VIEGSRVEKDAKNERSPTGATRIGPEGDHLELPVKVQKSWEASAQETNINDRAPYRTADGAFAVIRESTR